MRWVRRKYFHVKKKFTGNKIECKICMNFSRYNMDMLKIFIDILYLGRKAAWGSAPSLQVVPRPLSSTTRSTIFELKSLKSTIPPTQLPVYYPITTHPIYSHLFFSAMLPQWLPTSSGSSVSFIHFIFLEHLLYARLCAKNSSHKDK